MLELKRCLDAKVIYVFWLQITLLALFQYGQT